MLTAGHEASEECSGREGRVMGRRGRRRCGFRHGNCVCPERDRDNGGPPTREEPRGSNCQDLWIGSVGFALLLVGVDEDAAPRATSFGTDITIDTTNSA